MELAGVEEALLLSEEQPVTVELADGRQLSLGSLLREVLSALPVCCPATAAAYAAAGGHEIGTAVSLSEDEREIARQLGLSEEEYREIKAAG
jgi:phage I-like protein